jgi:hypothetical protein
MGRRGQTLRTAGRSPDCGFGFVLGSIAMLSFRLWLWDGSVHNPYSPQRIGRA